MYLISPRERAQGENVQCERGARTCFTKLVFLSHRQVVDTCILAEKRVPRQYVLDKGLLMVPARPWRKVDLRWVTTAVNQLLLVELGLYVFFAIVIFKRLEHRGGLVLSQASKVGDGKRESNGRK